MATFAAVRARRWETQVVERRKKKWFTPSTSAPAATPAKAAGGKLVLVDLSWKFFLSHEV